MTYFAAATELGLSASAVAFGLTDEYCRKLIAPLPVPQDVNLRHVPLFAMTPGLAPLMARRLAVGAAVEVRRVDAVEEDSERWDGLS